MNSVSATANSTGIATSTLPNFLTNRNFAINMFLFGAWFLSIPFVVHSTVAGADFIADGQASHPVFGQEGNLTAFYLMAWHMVFGAMMNFIAPYQVYLGLTHKKKTWHKYIGMSTIAIAFFGAMVGSLYFSLYYDINIQNASVAPYRGIPPFVFQPGTIYGVVMFYVIYKVVQSLVLRDFKTHKEWAIRLFILAIGSWLNRVEVGLWATAGLAIGSDALPEPIVMRTINGWGFYIIPMVIYEVYLRLGRRGAFKKLPAYAPFVASVTGLSILAVGSVVFVAMSYMR